MTDKNNDINADPKKVGKSAMNVLETILLICKGGKTTTILEVIKRDSHTSAWDMLSNFDRTRVEKDFMTLEYWGLIKQKGGSGNDAFYEPVPGVKEWFFDNKDKIKP